MRFIFQKRNLKIPTLFVFFSIGLGVFLMIALNIQSSAQETPRKVTVVGILNRVVVIGGETTGWIVELNREQEIFGNSTIEIDMDPKGQSMEKYSDKHVKITGNVMTRIGVERGYYPVIELETIQLAVSN
jgi:hypothetical protein